MKRDDLELILESLFVSEAAGAVADGFFVGTLDERGASGFIERTCDGRGLSSCCATGAFIRSMDASAPTATDVGLPEDLIPASDDTDADADTVFLLEVSDGFEGVAGFATSVGERVGSVVRHLLPDIRGER